MPFDSKRMVFSGERAGLVYGGCHGDDEKSVFDELCQIVQEAIEFYQKEGKQLPPPTLGRDFANKMQHVPDNQSKLACQSQDRLFHRLPHITPVKRDRKK